MHGLIEEEGMRIEDVATSDVRCIELERPVIRRAWSISSCSGSK
jgi:hypothetical protein